MFKARLLSFLALSLVVAAAPQVNVTDAHQKVPGWRKGIKHFVWVLMENRSFDNIMGGMTYTRDIDGVLKNPKCYPVNVTDPHNHQCVRPQPHDHNSVLQDPQHGAADSHYEAFGTYKNDLKAIHEGKMKPNMDGYLTMQIMTHGNENITAASDAINYYLPERIPVLTALAGQFTNFDRWFSSMQGPTNPSRAFTTGGTAQGHGRNDAPLSNFGLTNKGIFEALTEAGVDWRNYVDGSGTGPDANLYKWTKDTGHDKTNVVKHAQFFDDIKHGNLTAVSYMNPSCCGNGTTSMHPTGAVSDGERYLKEIYEAVRASKYWEETLILISCDESGGFADHVLPVLAPRPDDLTYSEIARDGSNYTLDYSMTGARTFTMLVSPWVPKGHVEHKGKNYGKEYTATSMLHFLHNFYNMPGPAFTPRVEWSSTWDDILLDKPRKDAPVKLPEVIVFNQS